MTAADILDMTAAAFRSQVDGYDNAVEFRVECSPDSIATVELEVGAGGYYFDQSFGNYLPDDPPTASFEAFGAADVFIVAAGQVIAKGVWEIDEEWLYDLVPSSFDDESSRNLTDDSCAEALVERIEERLYDAVDDPAYRVTCCYDEPENLDDAVAKGLTIREVLLRSEIVSPIA